MGNNVSKALQECKKSGGQRLVLDNCNLSSIPKNAFKEFPNLTFISLNSNQILQLSTNIATFDKLEVLRMEENKLVSLPSPLFGIKALVELNFVSNELREIPESLGSLQNLERLILKNNQLKAIPNTVGQLASLKLLYLSENALTSIPDSIGQLQGLTMLRLDDNKIKALPSSIGQLTSLQSLNVSSNSLTVIPPEIGQLENLLELSIYNNTLSMLPPEIGKLALLTHLDASENMIALIPEEIGQCTELRMFNMSENALLKLPDAIGGCDQLEMLKLSYNQLETLPKTLQEMVDLKELHVDHNNIKELPSELDEVIESLQLFNTEDNPLESQLNVPAVTPEEFEDSIWVQLCSGGVFVKYNRKGKVGNRIIYLDHKTMRLQCRDSKKNRDERDSIPIGKLTDVYTGRETATLRRHGKGIREDCYFSLVSPTVTFDLEATPETRDEWVNVFRQTIAYYKEHPVAYPDAQTEDGPTRASGENSPRKRMSIFSKVGTIGKKKERRRDIPGMLSDSESDAEEGSTEEEPLDPKLLPRSKSKSKLSRSKSKELTRERKTRKGKSKLGQQVTTEEDVETETPEGTPRDASILSSPEGTPLSGTPREELFSSGGLSDVSEGEVQVAPEEKETRKPKYEEVEVKKTKKKRTKKEKVKTPQEDEDVPVKEEPAPEPAEKSSETPVEESPAKEEPPVQKEEPAPAAVKEETPVEEAPPATVEEKKPEPVKEPESVAAKSDAPSEPKASGEASPSGPTRAKLAPKASILSRLSIFEQSQEEPSPTPAADRPKRPVSMYGKKAEGETPPASPSPGPTRASASPIARPASVFVQADAKSSSTTVEQVRESYGIKSGSGAGSTIRNRLAMFQQLDEKAQEESAVLRGQRKGTPVRGDAPQTAPSNVKDEAPAVAQADDAPSQKEQVDETATASRENDEATAVANKAEEEAAAAKKKAEEEAAAKKKADDEAAQKKADDEAAAKKKAEDEAAAQKADAEKAAASKKAEEEAAAKKKAEDDAAAKKKADDEAAAKKKAEEEAAAAKKKADDEVASKKKADDEAAAKVEDEATASAQKHSDEAAAAKKKAEEDAAAKKKTEDEAVAKKQAEEEAAAKKKADEEAAAKKKADDEAAAKKKAEEEAAAAKKKADDETAAKKKADEEAAAAKKKADDEAAAKKAESDAAAKKKADDEAAAKKKAEEEAAAAKKKADDEAAKKEDDAPPKPKEIETEEEAEEEMKSPRGGDDSPTSILANRALGITGRRLPTRKAGSSRLASAAANRMKEAEERRLKQADEIARRREENMKLLQEKEEELAKMTPQERQALEDKEKAEEQKREEEDYAVRVQREEEEREEQKRKEMEKEKAQAIQNALGSLKKSTVKRKEPELRLLQLKGKRRVRVHVVEATIKSLNHGDSFILDDKKSLYVFNGSKANRMEKAKAAEISLRFRDQERKGAKIVRVESADDAPEFWQTLGGSFADVRSPEDGGNDIDFERDMDNQVKLYRVERNEDGEASEYSVVELEVKRLTRESLTSDDCFVLDAQTEIYIWVGRGSVPAMRTWTTEYAKTLLDERPDWTHYGRNVEGGEEILFREKFSAWPDKVAGVAGASRAGASSGKTLTRKRSMLMGRIKKDKEVTIDVNKLHTAVRPEQELMGDGVLGSVEAWINVDGKLEEEHDVVKGQFYSAESYVILYTFTKGNALRYHIYFWQGLDATKQDKGLTALLVKEIQGKVRKEKGAEPVSERVAPGKEPYQFLTIFAGKFCVHRGRKSDASDKQTRLYRIRTAHDPVYLTAVEIDPKAELFNSRDTFVIHTSSKQYIWYGSGVGLTIRQEAAHLASVMQHSRAVKTVEEGHESKDMWKHVGGKASYAEASYLKKKDWEPRFYMCTGINNNFKVEPVWEVVHEDLVSDVAVIVDVISEVFVWTGSRIPEDTKKKAMETATEYVRGAFDGRLTNTPIYIIAEGQETSSFSALFVSWRTRGRSSSEAKLELVSDKLKDYEREYTWEELTAKEKPKGLDYKHLEKYLPDAVFEERFGMTKEAFWSMPSWKRTQKKKKIHFF